MTVGGRASAARSPLADDPPFAVMVAPNGARRTQADHPALPITPDEIARTAAACLDAGAAALHLHVRDADHRHSLDAERYRDALTAVRRAVGDRLVVQITTEAVGRYTPQQQMETVRQVRPDWVSIAVREIAPGPSDEPEAARFFLWMNASGVAAQFIVYTPPDVLRLTDWARRGVVAMDHVSVLFVLGRYTVGRAEHPNQLLRFLAAADPGMPWMTCAFGATEALVTDLAILLGGHARVGFENNLLRANGDVASGNEDLVAAAVAAAHARGRRIADADALRTMILR